MASASQSSIRFSDHEPEELNDYRPVNRASLAALLLGVMSGLAPLHPAFCVIPLLGVLAAAIGLLQLRNVDIRQTGRSLAVFGLFLSLLFCSWSVAREYSRRQHLYAQSRDCAERWFQTIRDGKHYEAHQLTLEDDTRIAPGASLEKHYAPDENASIRPKNATPEELLELDMKVPPDQQISSFMSTDTVKQIFDLGPNMTAEFQSASAPEMTENSTITVQLDYVLTGTVDSQPHTVHVRVSMARALEAETADWRVVTVDKPTSE